MANSTRPWEEKLVGVGGQREEKMPSVSVCGSKNALMLVVNGEQRNISWAWWVHGCLVHWGERWSRRQRNFSCGIEVPWGTAPWEFQSEHFCAFFFQTNWITKKKRALLFVSFFSDTKTNHNLVVLRWLCQMDFDLWYKGHSERFLLYSCYLRTFFFIFQK